MSPRLNFQSCPSDHSLQSPYDDNTLIEFLLDLPELTPDVLQGIRRIAENVDT
jgi:hypothetical protein